MRWLTRLSIVSLFAAVLATSASAFNQESEIGQAREPDYKALREEVKADEAAGKGDIETQTRALLDDVARLEGETFAIESLNEGLAARLHQAEEATAFWRDLVQEDQDYIKKWEEEKERRAAAAKAAAAATAAAAGGGPTVYLTRTGSKYHRGGCRYLRKSRIPISKRDARARGYSP